MIKVFFFFFKATLSSEVAYKSGSKPNQQTKSYLYFFIFISFCNKVVILPIVPVVGHSRQTDFIYLFVARFYCVVQELEIVLSQLTGMCPHI